MELTRGQGERGLGLMIGGGGDAVARARRDGTGAGASMVWGWGCGCDVSGVAALVVRGTGCSSLPSCSMRLNTDLLCTYAGTDLVVVVTADEDGIGCRV